MQRKRLIKIRDMLRNLKPTKMKVFDMLIWHSRVSEESCGFAACAIGWAIKKKLFRDLKWSGEHSNGRLHISSPLFEDHDGEYYGYEAVSKFLGIRADDAVQIFSASGYPFTSHGKRNITPKMVAHRIDELLERKDV